MTATQTAELDIQPLMGRTKRKVTLVLQAESSECGVACLAMVLTAHGHNTSLQELRLQCPSEGRGATLRDLLEWAARFNLAGRALRLEPGQLKAVQTPCILHWDMHHFVVYEGCRWGRSWIVDPATGRRAVSFKEIEQRFTGVALELLPSAQFRPRSHTPSLGVRQLLQGASGLKRTLTLLLVLSLTLQLLGLISPLYMQTVIDEVVVRGDVTLLQVLAMGFALVLILQIAMTALRQAATLFFTAKLNLQLGTRTFKHLLALPLSYFQRRSLGDIASRFASIDSVRELVSHTLVATVIDGVMAVLSLIVLFWYDVQLTLVVILCLALYLVLRLCLYPRVRHQAYEQVLAAARAESSFLESVRGIQTVKMQRGETWRMAQWMDRFIASVNRELSLAKLGIFQGAARDVLLGVENLVVVYLSALAVLDGAMTVGMFFAYLSIKQRFTGSAESLVDQLLAIRMIDVQLERIADVVLTEAEAPSPASIPGNAEGAANQAVLIADSVTFDYGARTEPVFSDLSFTVFRGEHVALCGPSGCGKTTLLKCLMGLLEPKKGEIRRDGVARCGTSLRDGVAAVLQDDHLFAGSLAENISGFEEPLNMQRIEAVARDVGLHDVVLEMPMGYRTSVGDMGSTLSGGQLQRVFLARALYRRPGLLFLDEATSHLDPDSELDIWDRIRMTGITTVFISHRPETIARADRVIQLGQGAEG